MAPLADDGQLQIDKRLDLLKKQLRDALDHLNRMEAMQQGGHPHQRGVLQVSSGALQAIKDIQQAEGEIPGLVLAEHAELEARRKQAAKNYYDTVSPVMIDSLLRYIAAAKYRRLLVNRSFNPDARNTSLETYPRRRDIELAEERGDLTPELGKTLLHALEHVSGDTKRRGIIDRNAAAHPSGERFRHNAAFLEQHEPGWQHAWDVFVTPEKAQVEDVFSNEFYNKPRYQAETWDPETEGARDPHYDDEGFALEGRKQERKKGEFVTGHFDKQAMRWRNEPTDLINRRRLEAEAEVTQQLSGHAVPYGNFRTPPSIRPAPHRQQQPLVPSSSSTPSSSSSSRRRGGNRQSERVASGSNEAGQGERRGGGGPGQGRRAGRSGRS